jgi:hypothetical protein
MTQVPVSITLTPTNDPSGAFVWQMGVGAGAPQGPPYPAIHVAHGNTATITFNIQNGPNQNITFADVPMLVPPKTNGFDTPSVNGISMTVTDHNLKQDHIPYVLIFNGAPKLDPIIDNDGGGSLRYFFSNPTVSGASLAVLAILAAVGIVLLVRLAVRKRGP